jgi:hypothetical protein
MAMTSNPKPIYRIEFTPDVCDFIRRLVKQNRAAVFHELRLVAARLVDPKIVESIASPKTYYVYVHSLYCQWPQGPKHLIRDNDQKYGSHFAAVAAGAQTDVIKTPFRAPHANAVCERFIGSVRRECLNHLLIRDERHLFRMLKAYIQYFKTCRPHQGIGQRLPQSPLEEVTVRQTGPILAHSVLSGLHHYYYRAAA